MFKGLTRYVFWQLFVGLTLVAVSLTCVVWLLYSLRFVDMIVNRGLSAGMFVYLSALSMPNFLTQILPISLFAITVFAYHRMIMDRELVVMRAAGLGQFSLARPAIILALLVVGAGYALSTTWCRRLTPSSVPCNGMHAIISLTFCCVKARLTTPPTALPFMCASALMTGSFWAS